MGYHRHDAVLVTCYQEDAAPLEEFRSSLPLRWRTLLVASPAPNNGFITYMFAPDGGKEGWATSQEGNHHRERFLELARKVPFAYVVEVSYAEDGWSRMSVQRGRHDS